MQVENQLNWILSRQFHCFQWLWDRSNVSITCNNCYLKFDRQFYQFYRIGQEPFHCFWAPLQSWVTHSKTCSAVSCHSLTEDRLQCTGGMQMWRGMITTKLFLPEPGHPKFWHIFALVSHRRCRYKHTKKYVSPSAFSGSWFSFRKYYCHCCHKLRVHRIW